MFTGPQVCCSLAVLRDKTKTMQAAASKSPHDKIFRASTRLLIGLADVFELGKNGAELSVMLLL